MSSKNILYVDLKMIHANKRTINYDPHKSSYSMFKPRNKELPYSYKSSLHVGGQKIKYKENTKYLGMILDGQVTWENISLKLIRRW